VAFIAVVSSSLSHILQGIEFKCISYLCKIWFIWYISVMSQFICNAQRIRNYISIFKKR